MDRLLKGLPGTGSIKKTEASSKTTVSVAETIYFRAGRHAIITTWKWTHFYPLWPMQSPLSVHIHRLEFVCSLRVHYPTPMEHSTMICYNDLDFTSKISTCSTFFRNIFFSNPMNNVRDPASASSSSGHTNRWYCVCTVFHQISLLQWIATMIGINIRKSTPVLLFSRSFF